MSRKRIFVTGASGCVGHYVVEEIMQNSEHDLMLALRDPGKLAIRPEWRDRITVIKGDMTEADRLSREWGQVDAALLIATSWGEGKAFEINCDANLALTDALIAAGCGRIVYFSSASVLDKRGAMLDAARDFGSEYIQSKYKLVEEMEARAGQTDIVGMFPTLVVGGDADKPVSHFARLLRQARPWAWLVKRLRADGRFHIIHARDIAKMTRMVIDRPLEDNPTRIVMGNPARTVNEFVAEFLAHIGKRAGRGVELKERYAEVLIKLFRIELSPWDRYCMQNRDLSHDVAVNPSDFGETPYAPNLAAALDSVGIGRER